LIWLVGCKKAIMNKTNRGKKGKKSTVTLMKFVFDKRDELYLRGVSVRKSEKHPNREEVKYVFGPVDLKKNI